MADPLIFPVEVDNSGALDAVRQIEAAINDLPPATIDADTGSVTDSVSDAVDNADTTAEVDADAGTVTDSVSDAVENADRVAEIDAEAGAVTDAVTNAVQNADLTAEVDAVVNVQSDGDGGFGELSDGIESSDVALGALLGKAKGAAGALGVGLGVSAAISSFTELDTGIREVRTLLADDPGAPTFEQLKNDAQDLANEINKSTTDVVPALYQAISAGVPRENAFEFLRQANETALGGATGLTTAVETLASVVNAYGEENLSAGEASDLLFSAVKGGITTIDDLGGSLFQVVPNAAAAGIAFGDITAAIATLTSQGVPTRVATTQIRQAIVELTKAGSETADTFERLAGKSFRDFIAEGGNLQQALQILETGAGESGLAINDLFGSVEAGNAALGLTGTATAKFAGELDNAADSAGNTAAAADEVRKSTEQTIDSLTVFAETVLQDVGEAALAAAEDLEPLINALQFVFDNLGQDFEIGPFNVSTPGLEDLFQLSGLNPVGQLSDAFGNAGDAITGIFGDSGKKSGEEFAEEMGDSFDRRFTGAILPQMQAALAQLELSQFAIDAAGSDVGLENLSAELETVADEMQSLIELGTAPLVEGIGDVGTAFVFAADQIAQGNEAFTSAASLADLLGISLTDATAFLETVSTGMEQFARTAIAQVPGIEAAFKKVEDASDPAQVIKAFQDQVAATVNFAENIKTLGARELDNAVAFLVEQGPERAGELAQSLVDDDATAAEFDKVAEFASAGIEVAEGVIGEEASKVSAAAGGMGTEAADQFGIDFDLMTVVVDEINAIQAFLDGVSITVPAPTVGPSTPIFGPPQEPSEPDPFATPGTRQQGALVVIEEANVADPDSLAEDIEDAVLTVS